jgi:poly-gamma-glutamate synthesis protein (capsule biosynthesis protein)
MTSYDPNRHTASLLSNILLVALFAFILFPLWYIAYEETRPTILANAFAENVEQIQDQTKRISLLFMGDMMFDRGVRTKILAAGEEAVFASTTRFLTGQYDLAIANLEGPITSNKSKTIDASGRAIPGFTFTFPTSTAQLLKHSGIDIVSLANNHTDNFGPAGFRETAQWLTKSAVQFFGNANNDSSNVSTVQCAQDICIGLIGYHQFTEGGEQAILNEIQQMVAKKAAGELDSIIVFPHWGIEYDKRPSASQKQLAHDWINAGADMVIGAHPHIVQSMEIYKEKPIFYSLGNYIFDQYFSYDTTHGIAIGLHLEKENPETGIALKKIKFIPLDLTGTTVKIANDVDRTKMLAEIVKISDGFIATSTKEQILGGEIDF